MVLIEENISSTRKKARQIVLANKNKDALNLLDIDSIFGGDGNNQQQPNNIFF